MGAFSFESALASLLEVAETDRERRLVILSANAFPRYVDAAATQERTAARLASEHDVTLRDAAEMADRRRRLAHDTAQYVCQRLDRLCARHGLDPACPELPAPEDADGRDPPVRDKVAGFAARVTLDRAFGDGRYADASGRRLLALAIADAPEGGYGDLFDGAC